MNTLYDRMNKSNECNKEFTKSSAILNRYLASKRNLKEKTEALEKVLKTIHSDVHDKESTFSKDELKKFDDGIGDKEKSIFFLDDYHLKKNKNEFEKNHEIKRTCKIYGKENIPKLVKEEKCDETKEISSIQSSTRSIETNLCRNEIPSIKDLSSETPRKIEIDNQYILELKTETEDKVDRILKMVDNIDFNTSNQNNINSINKTKSSAVSIISDLRETKTTSFDYNFYVFLTLTLVVILLSILRSVDTILTIIKQHIDVLLMNTWNWVRKLLTPLRTRNDNNNGNNEKNVFLLLLLTPIVVVTLVLYTVFNIVYLSNRLLLTKVPDRFTNYMDLKTIKKKDS